MASILKQTTLFGALLLSCPNLATAQVPIQGTWHLRQLSFLALRPLHDSLQHHLTEHPAAETNEALRRRRLVQRFTLRPNGTYQLLTLPAGQDSIVEIGTYELRHDTLFARTAGGRAASFNGYRVAQVKRRLLLLEYPLWRLDPFWRVEKQIYQQLNYGR